MIFALTKPISPSIFYGNSNMLVLKLVQYSLPLVSRWQVIWIMHKSVVVIAEKFLTIITILSSNLGAKGTFFFIQIPFIFVNFYFGFDNVCQLHIIWMKHQIFHLKYFLALFFDINRVKTIFRRDFFWNLIFLQLIVIRFSHSNLKHQEIVLMVLSN